MRPHPPNSQSIMQWQRPRYAPRKWPRNRERAWRSAHGRKPEAQPQRPELVPACSEYREASGRLRHGVIVRALQCRAHP